ncbi:hypothetical protein [Bdellovibrio sp. HCB-162]|uniref:hypothetical protein n=1 Tax=Bdellovibrio sp. HCB-162 TaxID=3394234 RepID=UPI0039BC2C0B
MRLRNLFALSIFVLLSLVTGSWTWAACSSPTGNTGTMDYFTAENVFKYCDGTSWVPMKYGGISLLNKLTDPSPYAIASAGVVAVKGNYAYVIDPAGSLLVLDITTLSNPTPVTKISDSFFNSTSALLVSGSYLIGVRNGTVYIVDITTPTAPVISGSVTNSNLSNASSLAVSGNYAYAYTSLTNPGRLVVIDISNKSAPVQTGFVSSPSIANGTAVAASGGYVYISVGASSITVIDATTPSSPAIIGSISDSRMSTIKAMAISGNYIYVVSTTGGTGTFSVIDITTKSNPTLVSAVTGANYGDFYGVNSLWVNGSLAYVALNPGSNSGGYLQTVDISNPLSPKAIFSYRIIGAGTYGAKYVSGDGNKLFVVDSNSMLLTFDLSLKPTLYKTGEGYLRDKSGIGYGYIATTGSATAVIDFDETIYWFDTSTPATLNYISQFSLPGYTNRFATGVAMKGNFVYSGNSNTSRLSVVDFTNPSNPILISGVSDPNYNGMGSMEVSGNYLYIARTGGLAVVDVSTPSTPTYVTKITTAFASAGSRLKVVGSKVYVTSNGGDLAIFDITTPTAPSLLGKVTDTTNLNGAKGLDVQGSYAYVAAMNCKCLTVVDVSNSASPSIVNAFTSNTYYDVIEDVIVNGSYLYTYSYTKGLATVDITTPTSPTPTSAIGGGGYVLVRNGNTLYAGGTGSVKAFNITTASTPSTTSDVDPEGKLEGIAGIASVGNYAYSVAATTGIFTVMDVTDKTNPVVIGSVKNTTRFNGATNLTVSGNYAYVVSPSNLTIVDISTPSAPSVVGFLSDATNLPTPKDVYVSGNYAYVAASNRLTVVNITNKAAPTYSTNLSHALISDCRQIVVSGSYAYLPCSTSTSLVIVSLATPGSPSVTGTFQDATNLVSARTVVVSGGYALVGASNSNGGAIVNISTPSAPSFVKTMPLSNIVFMVQKNSMIFFQSSTYGFGQMGISDPANPKVISSGYSSSMNISSPSQLAISGNYLYRAAPTNTMEIWSIADSKVALYEEASANFTNIFGTGYKIKVVGTTAYVTSKFGQRLTAVDISNIDSPTILGSLADPKFDSPTGIEISGNYAYISGAGYGYVMTVVDISDPANMKSLAYYSNYTYLALGENLVISGNYIFATTRSNGRVTSFDISNPIAPSLKSSVNVTSPYDLVKNGNYLYACSSSGVAIIDASNTLSMSLVTTFIDNAVTNCRSLALDGNYLYASGTTNKTFAVIDVSTPTSPVLLGSISDATNLSVVEDIKISGNYAYFATGSSRIGMIDITTKTAPVMSEVLNSSSDVGGAYELFVSGNRVLAPNFSGSGLSTYKAAPSVNVGSCTTGGTINYDTTQKVLSFCNGTNFKAMGPVPGAGGAGCSSPTATAGALEYFTATNKFKYCDGTNWVTVGN